MMYYIEYNGDIALFDNDRERLAHTQEVFPIFHGLEIKETDRPIENYRFADDEDYIIEKQAKERARLDQLCLTPSDVERALYYGMGMDFDDLKQFISQQAPNIDLKALSIELRANNFYRGATDKDGNRLIDMIGALLGYTPEDMDYLFEHKQLPQKS